MKTVILLIVIAAAVGAAYVLWSGNGMLPFLQ